MRVIVALSVPDDSDLGDIATEIDCHFDNADPTVWTLDGYRADDADARAITSDEGATFTPWADGGVMGFKVTAVGQPTRYVYLNPSGGCDTGNILDSDVFAYEGDIGDPVHDATVCYINIWEKP